METGCRFRLSRFDTLSSTSDHLRDAAEQGAADGMAVLAYVQTAGRGSRGRSWFDAPGNLALSVLLRRPGVIPTIWPFVAALATCEALNGHARGRLRLKWPNDVLDAQGGKVAGILVETGGGASPWVVIGIGANLRAAPELDRAAALHATVSVDAVADAVLARLGRWAALAEAEGFAPIRSAWMQAAHPLGTPLVVRSRAGVAREGAFAGLDTDGALLLERAGTVDRIATGDVLELA